MTHSTLPMWKNKRNVCITYKAIEGSEQIDDLVSYQPLGSDKNKEVHGVDTPSPAVPAAYDWRGKGWLKIASSHWEVLGYGSHAGQDWAVTYFAKTLFTPAGIDIYSRAKEGLSDELVKEIKEGLTKVEDPGFGKLASEIFEIQNDSKSKPDEA